MVCNCLGSSRAVGRKMQSALYTNWIFFIHEPCSNDPFKLVLPLRGLIPAETLLLAQFICLSSSSCEGFGSVEVTKVVMSVGLSSGCAAPTLHAFGNAAETFNRVLCYLQ